MYYIYLSLTICCILRHKTIMALNEWQEKHRINAGENCMQIALQLKPNQKKIAEQIIIIKNTYHYMQKKICDKKAVLHKIRKRCWGKAVGQCM